MDVITIRRSGETVTVREQRRVVNVLQPVYALDVTSGVMVGGVPYTGAYEATPSAHVQIFPTTLKTMRQDFVVHPIPSNYGLITWDGSTLTVS